ncbi:MAG TPA: hypothetical protein VKQ36_07320 [Ktedonobacterales bacterium]|nr:hypothetical protein [Ktedonobacterales bacterium]
MIEIDLLASVQDKKRRDVKRFFLAAGLRAGAAGDGGGTTEAFVACRRDMLSQSDHHALEESA